MIRAELLKLRRSSLWLIALLLPALAVATGGANYALNPEALTAGWASYWSQVVLFYGLLFFALAVSLLASASWRMEHQGSNQNLLLTSSRSSLGLASAKVIAILIPVAAMQLALAVMAWVVGVVLGLPGLPPLVLLLSPIVVSLAALPLVAAQSMLSMLLRSFAAPVAICLAGSAFGLLSLTGSAPKFLAYVVPQALATRGINLGSTAISESGALELGQLLAVIVPGLVVAAALIGLTAVLLQTWKRR